MWSLFDARYPQHSIHELMLSLWSAVRPTTHHSLTHVIPMMCMRPTTQHSLTHVIPMKCNETHNTAFTNSCDPYAVHDTDNSAFMNSCYPYDVHETHNTAFMNSLSLWSAVRPTTQHSLTHVILMKCNETHNTVFTNSCDPCEVQWDPQHIIH